MRDYSAERQKMVENQLVKRGITDQGVLRAMNTVPREHFVSEASQFMAYNDFPIPIGKGQTVSQPYMVALMTELLRLEGDEKVLEIGTGSGYQAAILSHLCKKVITIERESDLAAHAEKRLKNYPNVKVLVADGTEGYIYSAPYDAIIVTAGSEKVPKPLLDQLRIEGRLVIPLGGRAIQTLTLVKKKLSEGQLQYVEKKITDCRFVPLRGKYGW